jgi:hypothetical protein
MNKCSAIRLSALVAAICWPLVSDAFAQIQSTINCPTGHGFWDTLSVMMMDPGLAFGEVCGFGSRFGTVPRSRQYSVTVLTHEHWHSCKE